MGVPIDHNFLHYEIEVVRKKKVDLKNEKYRAKVYMLDQIYTFLYRFGLIYASLSFVDYQSIMPLHFYFPLDDTIMENKGLLCAPWMW